MAEENKKIAPKQTKTSLTGNGTKPTILDAGEKLDIDTKKVLIDDIIAYGLNGGLNTSALEEFTTISNNRDQVYQMIDTMAKDSTVSSIIRTYAENVCEVADNGHIIWCESKDPKISKFVNFLLNVMNADKNMYKWAYCLIKYGDVYLRLFRESDYEDKVFKKDTVEDMYSVRNVLNEDLNKAVNENINLSIHKANDPYSYFVQMVADPATMYEVDRFGKTYGYIEVPNAKMRNLDYTSNVSGVDNLQSISYRLKSGDVNIYQADDFVHACLDDDFSRFPETIDLFLNDTDYANEENAQTYDVKRGKSMLYDSYKVWREKSLLENSALLSRITRSSILRKVQVEVGDMPKEQAAQVLRRVKEMMEQKTALSANGNMIEYNNPGPVENNIYFTTHNGQGAVTVDSIGGDVEVKNLADLDWWNNKFYSSYGIPKQYFGFTDDAAGFNGGASLTIISAVYAKGVTRVQNALIQAMTDAINLFLLNRGLKSYLNNFTLKMKTPHTQDEKDHIESLNNLVSALSNVNGLFTEVEDKVRKLELIKILINSLEFGDGIAEILDAEIAATKEAQRKAAEEEAAEAAAEAAGGTAEVEEAPVEETPTEEASMPTVDIGEDEDLGNSSEAPMESFSTNGGGTVLVEGPDIVTEDDDLPSPNDIDENIDFSENR